MTEKLLAIAGFVILVLGAVAIDQHEMLMNSNHEIKEQQEENDGLRKDLGACQGFMRGN